MATYPVKLKDLFSPAGFSARLRAGEKHTFVVAELRGWYAQAQFRNDSAVLLPVTLSPYPAVPSGLEAVALALRNAELSADKNVLISGHTDGKGDTADNRKLSQIRAEAFLGMLRGDRTQFAQACHGPHLSGEQRYPSSNQVRGVLWDDYIDVLQWVQDTLGWICAYNPRSTLWQATCNFQKAYNDNNYADSIDGSALKITGKFDLDTWKAVFDCYEFHLQRNRLVMDRDALARLRNNVTFVNAAHPFVACGEDKPLNGDAGTQTASQADRRAHVCFFDQTCWEDASEFPCMSGECKPKQCPHWNPKWFALEPLPAKLEELKRPLRVRFFDQDKQVMPQARCRVRNCADKVSSVEGIEFRRHHNWFGYHHWTGHW